MKWWTIFYAIVACLIFNNALSAAENDTTEIINVKSISYTIDGLESVKFQFSAPLTPKIFTIKGDNPRLVIDLPRARYRGGKVDIPAGAECAGNLRIGLHTEPEVRTRVVLDLNPAKKVTFNQESAADEMLTVTLQSTDKEVVAVSKPLAPPLAEKKEAEPVERTLATEGETEIAGKETTPLVPTPAAEPVAESVPVSAPEEVMTPLPEAAPEKASTEITPAPSKEVKAKEPKEKVLELARDQLDKKTAPSVLAVKTDPVKLQKKPPEVKGAELLDVRFDDSSEKGEMVLFHLNDFFPPTVTAIETNNPGVVCEFAAMHVAPEVEETIFANGKFVERIRTEKQVDTDKVKVFLDLAPNYDYDLQQVFFKTDNLFVLIINELNGEKTGETAAK